MKNLIFALLLLPCFSYAVDAVPAAPAAVIAAMPEEAPVPPKNEAPKWLVSAMDTVAAVPVVGLVVVEVAKWLGVISSVLTILVTAILGILKVLSLVLPAARLANIAIWLAAAESSKVMYWLKFFSMYNATKSEEKKS